MAGSKNGWQESAQNYRAFLLRCWQEWELENGGEPGESSIWRFALVQLNDKSSTKGFACLEELVDYLRGQLGQTAEYNKNPAGYLLHLPKKSTDAISEQKRECE